MGPWRLAAAVVALSGLVACDSEPESNYPWAPDKPVTVIVPWAAGGSTDQVSRVVAGELETALGQKFVVVNQPGASGTIGKSSVWNAAHDGYTWAAGAPKQLGEYKLLANCQCFGGQELDAEKTFKLDAGEIFQVRSSHSSGYLCAASQRSSNSQSLSTHGLWSPETVWRCNHSSDPVQLSVALAIDRRT